MIMTPWDKVEQIKELFPVLYAELAPILAEQGEDKTYQVLLDHLPSLMARLGMPFRIRPTESADITLMKKLIAEENPTFRMIGFFHEEEIPRFLRRGCKVRIKKGTPIKSMSPSHGPDHVAGRTMTITVHHNGCGMEYQDGRTNPLILNPSVIWAGTGGYWQEVDINLVEAV